MSLSDPNALLRAAEQHHAEGAPHRALPLVESVLRIVPGHPQVLQLHAIVLRALGHSERALGSIAAAHAGAPGDARIADTLGNILSDLGRQAEAIAAYRRAIAADPSFASARLHLAASLQDSGKIAEARAAYIALGDDPAALVALAGLDLDSGAQDEAALRLDRALALTPDNLTAGQARARIAFDRGDDDAAQRLSALLEAHPDDRALLLQGLEELGTPAIAAAVERLVTTDPNWRDGLRALALHRRQRERRDDWVAAHERLLAENPRDVALWRDLIDLHSVAQDFAGAAAAADRAAAATDDDDFLAAAFAFHSAAGADQDADRLLADPRLVERIGPLARAKHLLRRRDPEQAERLLAALCGLEEAPVETWAMRGIAWQLLGDPRWEWLNWQPDMVATLDLDLGATEHEAIVAKLRDLHRGAVTYIGQSVRDGTQTRGNLFGRVDPDLHRARDAILTAIEAYRAGLPPADPAHPILRYRDAAWRMMGSWSVRLTQGGFHVSHIHPKGIVSSASYWVVPPEDSTAPARAGWLELGRPPAYLGLDLEPTLSVKPVPGRLVLFPSTLHHGTRPVADGERITAAFDIAPVA